MAYRRKRIVQDQIDGFLARLKNLPIEAASQTPAEVLELPAFAQSHNLTNYDAAYLSIALSQPLMQLSAGPQPQLECRFFSSVSTPGPSPCGFQSAVFASANRQSTSFQHLPHSFKCTAK